MSFEAVSPFEQWNANGSLKICPVLIERCTRKKKQGRFAVQPSFLIGSGLATGISTTPLFVWIDATYTINLEGNFRRDQI